jgi:hypothetical protein
VRYRVLLSVVSLASAVTASWVLGIKLVANWLSYAPEALVLGSLGAVIFTIVLIVGAALGSSSD